jgi:hypothetical protein
MRYILKGFLFLAVLILVMLTPAASAQETFGLSAEDFELFTNANAASAATSSYDFTFTLTANTQGIPGNDINATLNGTGTIFSAPEPALSLAVTGTAVGSDGTNLPLDAQLRLVGDVIYLNIVDPTNGESTGWVGQTLEEAGAAFTQGFNSTAPFALDSGVLSGDTSSLGDLTPLITALSEVNAADFIAMQRVGTENIDGVETVHFTTTLDVVTFLRSDAFEQILEAAMTLNPDSSQSLSQAQIAGMSAMMGVAFEGTTLTFDQYIDEQDMQVRRAVLDLNLAVDPEQMGQADTQPISVKFNFDISLSNFDAAEPVLAPEGAVMLPSTTTSEPQATPAATASDAESITAGTPVTAQLIGNFTPVEFTYTGAENEIVNIYVRSATAGQIDTIVELVDSAGEVISRNDDHTTTRPNLSTRDSAIEGFALPAAGSYIIRVNSFDGQTIGPVEVTVETGNPLTSTPATTTTTTTTSGDTETFTMTLRSGNPATQTITATAGEVLTISVRDTSGTLDPKLTLSDANGSTLAENDDHSSGDTALDSLDARIVNFLVTSDATYTIEVSDFFGNAGTAEVSVTRGSASAPIVATPVPSSGEVMTGELVAGGRFSQTLTLDSGEVVTITARDTGNTLDPKLILRDSNGVIVAENDDHSGGDTTLDSLDARIQNFIPQTSGTYTIEVIDVFGAAGSFELTISR